MDNIIHTEEYKGKTINIVQDGCAENPFLNWDGEGKIIFHARADYVCNTDISYEEAKQIKFTVPLSAYIHSGINLSVLGECHRCQWDTSDYIAYWIPDQKNNPVKSKKIALKFARQACELFNQYANGEVYGYDIPQLDESCFGYYGEYEYCIQEAKSIINYNIKEEAEGMKMFHAM